MPTSAEFILIALLSAAWLVAGAAIWRIAGCTLLKPTDSRMAYAKGSRDIYQALPSLPPDNCLLPLMPVQLGGPPHVNAASLSPCSALAPPRCPLFLCGPRAGTYVACRLSNALQQSINS